MQSRSILVLVFVSLVTVSACGADAAAPPPRDGAVDATPAGTAAGTSVPAPQGPIDESLAERGETLFVERGCSACHSIGEGRLTGPDLAGVLDRRSFEWIVAMIVHPDSMTRDDPDAKRLMGEYMTQMPNLGIPADDARALFEYFRKQSQEGSDE